MHPEQLNHTLEQRIQEGINNLRTKNDALVEAQEQLNQQAHYLNIVSKHTHDMITIYNLQWRIEFISTSIEDITGYNYKKFSRQSLNQFIHPDDLPEVQRFFNHRTYYKDSATITYRQRHREGYYFWVKMDVHPVIENGELKNWLTVSHDITMEIELQHNLAKERDKLHSIMMMSPIAITVLNPNGKITFANKRAEKLLGVHRDEIENRTYNASDWESTDLDGSPWPDEKQPFMRVMATQQAVWDIRHAIVRDDGKRIALSINGVPTFDSQGEIDSIIFTVDDITERLTAEKSLLDTLETERELNRMREQFISVVTHEFRTPLAVIQTSSDLLTMGLERMTRQDMSRRINKVKAQVHRLNQILSDITTLSKQDEQVLSITKFNFTLLANQTISEMKMMYASDDIRLLIDLPDKLYIEADEFLMHRILGNIMSNAFKYTIKGDVAISASISEIASNREELNIIVRDTGIGIPAEDLKHLFSFFYRAQNVGAIGGTGIGMAIIKQALDLCDGKIKIDSIENEGTTITILIPVKYVNQDNEQVTSAR